MKSENTPFYIGWQEEMPNATRAFLRPVVLSLLVLLPLLAFSVVYWQKPFNNHHFEFGQLTEIVGTFYAYPHPVLIANDGELSEGLSPEILLVGYGKFGAAGIIADMEAARSRSLVGKNVKLRGSLIYGDGKALLELTEQAGALVEVSNRPAVAAPAIPSTQQSTIRGEVIDPKCYFGVMKPGEGKTHKSCAVRCISGGIPPILKQKVEGEANAFKYYLILDDYERPINQRILPLVGENVHLTGRTTRINGWDVIFIDIEHLPLYIMTKQQLCSGHLLSVNMD